VSHSIEISSIQREQKAEERIEIEFPLGIVSAPHYSGLLIEVLKGPEIDCIQVTEENPKSLSDLSQEIFGGDYNEERRDKLLRVRIVAQKKLEPAGHIIEAVREKEGTIVTGMFLKERPQVFETSLEKEDSKRENTPFTEEDIVLNLKEFFIQNYTSPDLPSDKLHMVIKEALSVYQIPRLRQGIVIRRLSSELEQWWGENNKRKES